VAVDILCPGSAYHLLSRMVPHRYHQREHPAAPAHSNLPCSLAPPGRRLIAWVPAPIDCYDPQHNNAPTLEPAL
jgi:hypothetical protein